MTSIKQFFFTYRYWIFIGFIFLAFLAIRLPGLDIPYHQDEYKWPLYANPEVFAPGSVPHPPLTELIYRDIGHAIGYNNFRAIPFSFSVFSFFLVAYAGYLMFGKKGSLWITSFFTFSFYGVLASLTVDVDGAVMVFFFLCALVSYIKIKAKNYQISRASMLWFIAFILSILLGFLVKLSFIIPIGVFATDFFIEKKYFSNKKKVLLSLVYTVGGLIGLAAVIYLSQFVFPFFRLEWAMGYWDTFIRFAHRGWFQTLIQFSKAVMYLSPFLVLTPLFLTKELFGKNRIFLLFIGYGLLFYLLLFDFSIGALDRYFAFLIVPLCFIAGSIYSGDNQVKLQKKDAFFISVAVVLLFAMQFLSHAVPPQHPKTEWINAIISFDWTFLFPFSGGSGPTGFYVSFLFIGLTWLLSFIFIAFGLKNNRFKVMMLWFVLLLGASYNFVFIEEYMFGKINGSPYKIFKEAKEFIISHDEIKSVLVYNDIGGYEIRETGKYARRMYAAPQFADEYKKYFETFSGHILYIDIPRIAENTVYTNYMRSCVEVHKNSDRYISATIFDCRK